VAGGRTQGVALGLEDGSILIVSSAKGDLATTLQGYEAIQARFGLASEIPAHGGRARRALLGGMALARSGHQRRVNAIAGRTDGTGVYTSGDDGVVVLWDLATGQVQGYAPSQADINWRGLGPVVKENGGPRPLATPRRRFVADKKGVRALQLNHAETVLAVAGHSVRLFSVSDHRLIKVRSCSAQKHARLAVL